MRSRLTLFLVLVFSCWQLGRISTAVSADNSSGLAPPTSLWMGLVGSTQHLVSGSWVNHQRLVLHFTVPGGATSAQVEVRPASEAFHNQATASTSTNGGSSVSLTISNLSNGTEYHWQARAVAADGTASAWTPFSQAPRDFGIDRSPPLRPVITSPTNPLQYRWYHNRLVELSWASHDSPSGVAGFKYAVEWHAHVIPAGGPLTSASRIRLRSVRNGVSFVAVRAMDRAGNWSPTATFRLQLDRTPPRFAWIGSSHFSYNPYQGQASIHFRLSKTSSVQVRLYRVGRSAPVRTFSLGRVRGGVVTQLTWNGRDSHGHMAGKGFYFFVAKLVDHALNVSQVHFGGLWVTPQQAIRSATGQPLFPNGGKLIIVSLSRQTLYAYGGTHLAMQTFVTTGNPSLPTPVGSYQIMAKYHPYEFISPWPPGSPYWYAPSLAQYAMLFRDGGYFLHDAPWRSAFGPGTNGAGQPGTNYGGTHGCVNIPPGPTFFLWNWAPVGTAVDVVP